MPNPTDTPLTPDEIAEGLRECEAATEGPLHALPPYPACEEGTTDWTVFTDDDGGPGDLIAECAMEGDAKFFAHARTHYPRALRALQAQARRIEELGQVIKDTYEGNPMTERLGEQEIERATQLASPTLELGHMMVEQFPPEMPIPLTLHNVARLVEALAYLPRALATIRSVEGELQQARKSELAWLESYQKRVRELDDSIAELLRVRDVLAAENAALIVERDGKGGWKDVVEGLRRSEAARRHDIDAYRGALGYAIPCSPDGTLSDGTTPKNGLAEALSTQNQLLKNRIIELENSITNHFHREHLEGGGPKIDRFERENEALRHELSLYKPSQEELRGEV